MSENVGVTQTGISGARGGLSSHGGSGPSWLLSSSTWRSDRGTVFQQQECPNMERGSRDTELQSS